MDDTKFLRNVHEAREFGFDLVCAECGCGLLDASDSHESLCTHNPDYEENVQRATRWAAKNGA